MKDADFKKNLTKEQYQVLRKQGTEAPFSGQYLYNKDKGVYNCAACGAPLFKSDAKYESKTPGLAGWPSFADVIGGGQVELKNDDSWGMHRVEVTCKNCGSHIGHVFEDDDSPSGQHYCVNSCALDFLPKGGRK